MADHIFQPESLAVPAGQIPDRETGARAADLPDHQLRVRQRRSRGQPVRPAELRQCVLPLVQPDGGRAGLASAGGMAAEAMALMTILQQAGVLPDMVRMSAGIEQVDDLLWDIDQALAPASQS